MNREERNKFTSSLNSTQYQPPIYGMSDEQVSELPDFNFTQDDPPTANATIALFRSQSLNQWMNEAKTQPIPARLFGDFWFEGELCFLFAETNQGKSVAAVQIGDAISKGTAISGFPLEAGPQTVLLFDFELTAKQLEKRYSENYTNHYVWSDKLVRIELNVGADIPTCKTFEQHLIDSIEVIIQQTGARIIILDNLTFLRADTESAKDAAPLMKMLQVLKRRYGLSMLIVGHTPKRDSSRPLIRNDLQGSSRLAQFADSMFAIGGSVQDKRTKYFKQIKVRAVEYRYEADNVVVCELTQPGNFLGFYFQGFSTEDEHLRRETDTNTDDAKYDEYLTLKTQGLGNDEISGRLGYSHRSGLKKLVDRVEKSRVSSGHQQDTGDTKDTKRA